MARMTSGDLNVAPESPREGESLAMDTLRSVPVLLWASNAQGKQCWSNSCDRDPGAWLDAVDPDDRVKRDIRYWSSFHARLPFEMEYRVSGRNDVCRWVLETAAPRYSSSGDFEGYAGAYIDITARRNAEDALIEANEHFRMLTRSTPNIAFISDASGRLLYANDRWAAFTGLELDGRSRWIDTIHADDRDDCRLRWARALATSEGFEAEYRLRGSGDRYEWHLLRVLPGAGDQPPKAWVGSCVSIDRRKRVEAELQWSERMYRSLAEAIPALVMMTSPAGEMQYCNERLLAYCGRTMDELRGNAWSELIHPEDAMRGGPRWLQRVQAGRPYTAEYRLRAVDGGYRWHLGHTVPLKDDAGEVIGWLGATIDIHGRKQAEERQRELAEANQSLLEESQRTAEELRRANLAKDEFLSMVSHELRTPITTIFGNAQILRRDPELPREARDSALGDIAQEASRLQQMIDNMFVLARAEAGQAPSPEPVLLRRIGERLVAAHRVRHPGRTISVHVAESTPPASAEPSYTEQILRNLLTNAEKYSPGSEPIEITIESGDGEVIVRVLDRGRGIDESELDQVFTAFYRSPRTSGLASGGGIGLAVCKRLVESQGGRIWLAARAGGGTEAGFALPVAEEALQ
jgi:PAS domain S-box-containing protein